MTLLWCWKGVLLPHTVTRYWIPYRSLMRYGGSFRPRRVFRLLRLPKAVLGAQLGTWDPRQSFYLGHRIITNCNSFW